LKRTIKAVMFNLGVILMTNGKFDYIDSLRRAHKVLENKRIAPSFEEFKQAYLRVRECLWNDLEPRE
jgi:hypothetical protein